MRRLALGIGLAVMVAFLGASAVSADHASVIDFEGIAEGTVVSAVSSGNGISGGPVVGSVDVFADHPADPGTNRAMIFDATCSPECSGQDNDLEFPANGNILIISEDLDSTDPDDGDVRNSKFEFDFSGLGQTVTVEALTMLDVETEEGEAPGVLEVFSGACGTGLLKSVEFLGAGNHAAETVSVDQSGVSCMRITLKGSGSVDNVEFAVDQQLQASTITTISATPVTIAAGEAVTWTVTEQNDGDVDLTSPLVNVDDSGDDDDDGDIAVLVAPPDSGDDGNGVLEPGETWSWSVVTNPTADTTLIATGHGTDPLGNDITYPDDPDERDAASVDVIAPSTITTISATPGTISAGEAVTWLVTEQNDGDVELTSPLVNVDDSGDDDDDGDVTVLLAPPDSGDDGDGVLEPGETWSWSFATSPTADTTLVATGHGTDPLGNDITYPGDPDERDEATVRVEVTGGGQGCTPGFWKTRTIDAVWGPTGYSTSQTLESVFEVPDALSFDNTTLVNALKFGGGPGVTGGAKILLRASVASLLNAAHPLVSFDMSEGAVVSAVNTALASGDRDTMLTLAGELDELNNSGCSIDAHGNPTGDD